MHCAIVRIEKYKKTDINGVAIEALRTKEQHTRGLNLPRTLNDWDIPNIVLTAPRQRLVSQDIADRMTQYGVSPRNKTTVVGLGVFSQAPTGQFDTKSREEIIQYFESVQKEIVQVFAQGDSNRVLYSVVHLDEKEPHLHCMLLPIVEDERGQRLNCKAITGTADKLRAIQDTFYRDIFAPRGFDRGELTSSIAREERKKHISTAEYRATLCATQAIYNYEELTQISQKVKEQKNAIQSINQSLQEIDSALKSRQKKRQLVHVLEDTEKNINKLNNQLTQQTAEALTVAELIRRTYQNLANKVQKEVRKRMTDFDKLYHAMITEIESTKLDLARREAQLEREIEKKAKELVVVLFKKHVGDDRYREILLDLANDPDIHKFDDINPEYPEISR